MLHNLNDQIIKATEPFIVVNASAAAGKTYCITERVRWLIQNHTNPSDIVLITFTNMAADEISERLGEEGKNCFIGTIHSYVNYLLMSGGVYTGNILEDEKFDELFHLLEQHPDCVKPIEHLLLDEAQDTDTLQWKIIFDILKPKNWTIVGDTRQSIYGFRGAEPRNFIAISQNPNVKVYDLLYNHRNGSNILNYAKKIINKSDMDLEDNSISLTSNRGQVIEITYDQETILKYIQNLSYDYKDWFVLTRTNAELDDIKNFLITHNIPCDTFKRADLNNKELSHRMKQNTVKVLTIHSAKGLEANAVVVIGAKFWNDEERRVNYVAATRAKELLIWTTKPKKIKSKKKDTINWE